MNKVLGIYTHLQLWNLIHCLSFSNQKITCMIKIKGYVNVLMKVEEATFIKRGR